MDIKVEYKGKDSWGRKVYQNTETGRWYKYTDYRADLADEELRKLDRLHTTSGFEGEPNCPLREDVNIILASK